MTVRIANEIHTTKLRCVMTLICCLPLAGCIHSSYPPSWPAPIHGSGTACPDISGRYQNQPLAGKTGYGGGLFDDMTNEGWFGNHACDSCTVELQWLDEGHDSLRITLIYADASKKPEEETLRQSEGNFTCSDGGFTVAFSQGGEFIADGRFEWGQRTYWLAQDGSLIRFETMQALGHALVVVPVYLSKDEYVRWGRATPAD